MQLLAHIRAARQPHGLAHDRPGAVNPTPPPLRCQPAGRLADFVVVGWCHRGVWERISPTAMWLWFDAVRSRAYARHGVRGVACAVVWFCVPAASWRTRLCGSVGTSFVLSLSAREMVAGLGL
jgi:hypothetical protein